MTYKPVEGFPALYGAPQPRVELRGSMTVVEVDDVVDGRDRSIRIVFEPCQAVRITTEDCFIYEDDEEDEDGGLDGLAEVVGSPWVEELTAALAQLDQTATFMNKAGTFSYPPAKMWLKWWPGKYAGMSGCTSINVGSAGSIGPGCDSQ